jgi:hypothetical protein
MLCGYTTARRAVGVRSRWMSFVLIYDACLESDRHDGAGIPVCARGNCRAVSRHPDACQQGDLSYSPSRPVENNRLESPVRRVVIAKRSAARSDVIRCVEYAIIDRVQCLCHHASAASGAITIALR